MRLKATIIISVYNRIDFLQLVLAGLESQTEKDFEVIVSDDGSNEIFVKALKEMIEKSPLTITHNWHEDMGFRKNKLLNKSICLSATAYLIFLDGDCIPHSHFVEEHLKNAMPKVCLVGRRVDLSARLTEKMTPDNARSGKLGTASFFADMMVDYAQRKLFHVMNGFYARNSLLRKFFNRKEKGILGANFSLHKDDMLAINGFDERYVHPTFGEDSDIELRLRLIDIKMKPVLNMAICYHCYHTLLPRTDESRIIYNLAVAEQCAWTPYGIKKSL